MRLLNISISLSSLALALSWLLLADSSPLSYWLLVHPAMRNMAVTANLPAYIVAAIGSGNAHTAGTSWTIAAMAMQWLFVGLLVGWAWCRVRPNNSFKPNPLRGSA
jgi:hypothetical protein